MRIQRIYHRRNPIINGAPPLRPLGWSNIQIFVQVWEHLERSGVSDVTGVWGFFNGLITVIALRQRYAGHAKQALITAAGFRQGDMKTYYVTVDEDIDPTNLNEVLWAMCTRVDPATSIDIIRDAWTADLDPRVSPARRESRRPDCWTHADQRLPAVHLARSISEKQCIQRRGAPHRRNQMARPVREGCEKTLTMVGGVVTRPV